MTRSLVILLLISTFLLLLFLSSSPLPQSQKGSEWVSFDEAVERAKDENKKLLVDVYTDWCGWCKKMDKEVYTDPSVVSLLSSHFITVKLNAESSRQITYKGTKLTERNFAAAVGVTGYPSTIFFEPDAKPITLLPGYVPANRFTTILQYIGEDHYKKISFDDYAKKMGAAK